LRISYLYNPLLLRFFSFCFLFVILFQNIFSQSPFQFNDSNLAFQSAGLDSLFLLTHDTTTHLSQNMDEIVVSATRWNERAGDIPMKISAINAQDVKLNNPQTAADMLAVSGEVFIQKSQQGGGSPMIRGFSANRLLYTVDGVRMNNAIFRSGNLQQVISLDPFAIEKTEILFGPGSVMYGSDALGGVMYFQTLKPRLSNDTACLFSAQLVSRSASANHEFTQHADFNIGFKKFAMLTSFTHSKYGDLHMGSKGPDDYLKHFVVQRMDSADKMLENKNPLIQNPTAYSQFNIMQKFRYRPSELWDFEYAFQFSETSDYSRYDRLIELQKNGLPVSAVWNYGPQKWMMNVLSITNSKENLLYHQMVCRISQQHFEESRIDRKFNHHRLRTQLENVEAYSAQLEFEKHWHKHHFSYGGEGILNQVISKGSAVDIRNNSPLAVPDRYPQSTWESYAAYMNYQLKLSDKFIFQTGLRYNVFEIKSDFTRHLKYFAFDFSQYQIKNASTIGNAGFVYKPISGFRTGMNISTGFRAPNVDDVGKIFDFTAGDVIVPNVNLKSEYVYNAEWNISKAIGRVFCIDVTTFATRLNNAMVRRAYTINGSDSAMYNVVMSKVYAIQNAAYSNIFGFHLKMDIQISEQLRFLSVMNYQKGIEEMDNGTISSSRHAAPAFGLTRITYSLRSSILELYTIYRAAVKFENLNEEERQKSFIYATDGNGNPYSPAWYTINMKMDFQISKKLSVQTGIENITDRRYRPYSSGLAAAGRNVMVSLRLVF